MHVHELRDTFHEENSAIRCFLHFLMNLIIGICVTERKLSCQCEEIFFSEFLSSGYQFYLF